MTVSNARAVPSVLDGFADPEKTDLDTTRMLITDEQIGGKSQAIPTYEEGILKMEGSIAPSRGQPGFISLVLLMNPLGLTEDLSEYEGIELRIRVHKGTVSVVAASSKIQNYDYHTMAITRSKEFKVMRIPFTDMKRIWSEQTPLDLSTITSINVVASGMQPGAFEYELDSIGFYKK